MFVTTDDEGGMANLVDSSVEHIGCHHTVVARTTDEARSVAVAMRDGCDETLSNGRRPWVRALLVLTEVSLRKIRRLDVHTVARHDAELEMWLVLEDGLWRRQGVFAVQQNRAVHGRDHRHFDVEPLPVRMTALSCLA
jgi:metal-dependent HD superfamily phosphatase/phosphodiesterase